MALLMDGEDAFVKDPADIKVVGHRVVHGGEKFTAATVIDEAVMAAIEEAATLAPLHNPANIMGIRAAEKVCKCPQVRPLWAPPPPYARFGNPRLSWLSHPFSNRIELHPPTRIPDYPEF